MVASDAQGNLFVLTDAGEVFQFDEDGISAGRSGSLKMAGQVLWIAADGCEKLYASTAKGIFVLDSAKTFTRKRVLLCEDT